MTDAELLEQAKIGQAWISKSRRTRWSLGLMRFYLTQHNPWPVDVNHLDMILARLESLLEEKLASR
jgi:hypothetical protein